MTSLDAFINANNAKKRQMKEDAGSLPSSSSGCPTTSSAETENESNKKPALLSTDFLASSGVSRAPLVNKSRRPSAISFERHGSFCVAFDDFMADSDDEDDDDDHSVDIDDDDEHEHADVTVAVNRAMRSIRRVLTDMTLRASELSPENEEEDGLSRPKPKNAGKRRGDSSRLLRSIVPDVARIEEDVIRKAVAAGKIKRTEWSRASVAGCSKVRRNLSFSVAHHEKDREHAKEQSNDGETFDMKITLDEEASALSVASFSPFRSLPPILKNVGISAGPKTTTRNECKH